MQTYGIDKMAKPSTGISYKIVVKQSIAQKNHKPFPENQNML